MANILVMKKRGERYKIEIGPRRKNSYIPANCNMEVNMENYKDVSLFLSDLQSMWGVPIDKAIEHYLKQKGDDGENTFW